MGGGGEATLAMPLTSRGKEKRNGEIWEGYFIDKKSCIQYTLPEAFSVIQN